MAADDRAVVVGINRYPGLGDLEGPENDARAFSDWLKSPSGGDIAEDQIALILSSLYDTADDPSQAEPTVVAVQRACEFLMDLAERNEGKAGRRLYLFLAGHGFAPEMRSAALLMANATKKRAGHHIPGMSYADMFARPAYFDEVVLFMDCCRENYPRAPLHILPYEVASATKPARYFYVLATKFSRAARERPFDGGVRGLFTEALLAGLRGKARNPNGDITGTSLHDYLRNTVPTAGQPGEPPQEPVFVYEEADDLIFAAGVPPPRFHIRVSLLPPHAGKAVELVDGGLRPLPGRQVAADRWEWEVDQVGIYKLGVVGGQQQFLEVKDEETIDIQL